RRSKMSFWRNHLKIQIAETEDQIKEIFFVLRELRSTPSFQEVVHLWREAKARDGFQLAGCFIGEICVGIMGFRVLFDFTHGKHLYIDDLVVTQEKRSQGIGEFLLGFAEKIATENDCKGLRL